MTVPAPDSLFVGIVKMQVYYINHYIDKRQIIAKHQTSMNEKMEPLTRLIINTRLKSKKECDEYLKKLAVDIIAHYALGNPETSAQVCQFVSVCFMCVCVCAFFPQTFYYHTKYQLHIKIPFVIHFYDTMSTFTSFYLGAKKRLFRRQ